MEQWPAPGPMRGRSILITGATSGLGFEAAVQFSRLGASVTFVARDPDRAASARASISKLSGRDDVEFLVADMSDLDSVRRAAATYRDQHPSLDVLIHNAGALSRVYQVAPGGSEMTVATHVLGPFLLTGQLLPALRSLETGREGPARVLTVSSGGMYTQRFQLDRLEVGPHHFDGVAAYARAKRAQLVLNHEWAARYPALDVVFHAMHPGWADTPGLRASLPSFYWLTRPVLRTPQQGIDTLIWLSQALEPAQSSGKFWLDRRPRHEHKLPWTRPTNSSRDQSQLWEWCAERTGGPA